MLSTKLIEVKISGLTGSSLLMNNPRTIDPLNGYSKKMKEITSNRKKTDEDFLRLRELEVEAKTYWDESLGVYVPSRWLLASLGKYSFELAKISKAKVRSSVFPTESKIKLHYAGEGKVASLQHVMASGLFITQNLKQGQVSVTKCAPMFNDWSFSTVLEVDVEIINLSEVTRILEYGARYGGFGDFRPTFGRSEATIREVGALKSAA